MDHRLIEDENIAELYVTGRLSAEDEEAFEAHLLDCSECRNGVALADDLRTSIRAVAAEDAAKAAAQIGLLAWLARQTRSARAGLLMAALVAVAALPVWLQADRMRLERELGQAQAANVERPAAPAPAPVPQAPAWPSSEELERLAAEKSRLEEELRAAQAGQDKLNEQLARITAPQSAHIVPLGTLRGASDAIEIEIGPAPELKVFSLQLPQVEYETYRATLVDSRGRTILPATELKPTGNETLDILLYTGRLEAGASYRFRVEGIEEGGRAVPLPEVSYSFRAVRG